jgi:hypothetical protein
MAAVLPDDPAALAAVFSAMADELESYLDQDGLYRNLVVQTPGHTYKPVMTLGLMWDARAALRAREAVLPETDRDAVAAASAKIDAVIAGRRAAYDARLMREVGSLLDSWSWYLDGCEHSDDDCVGNYPAESWIRTRLEMLLARARGDGLNVATQATRLGELDERLRSLFAPGAFVGSAEESSARPADRFWWLYGRPRRR